jgi:hypothetical protein
LFLQRVQPRKIPIATPAAETSATSVSRGKFVGTWTLTNVTYDGLVPNAVQNVFDQAAPSAFVGSTWKFTNSGNGVVHLNQRTIANHILVGL